MSLFGGHKPHTQSKQPSILGAMRVSTSTHGICVPLQFGQGRVAGHLLWYGNFTPIAHTSSQASGGKGGGGGSKSTQTTSYTYQAAVQIMLCRGAIQGLYNVWDTKGRFAQQTVTENYTVPSGGGTYTVSQSGNYYDDFGVSRGDTYDFYANDYGDIPNRHYSGSYQTRMARASGAPATGQYYRPAPGQYQFAAGDVGKTVAITYVYNVPDSTGTGQPTTSLSLTLFNGAQGQSVWPFLSSYAPSQAIGYSNVAHVDSQNMDLGSSGSLPNYTYEVVGLKPYGAGINDANPSDVINFLLTDPIDGAGINAQYVGSLAQYSNYCIANGLLISPLLDSQRASRDWIAEFLEATNSQAFWSEGLIKIVPFGDTTVVGNGVTYTPQTSPIFDFTDDDYIDKGEPIKVSMQSMEDAYNQVQVEWENRSNSYNPEPIEEKDDNAISLYGLRADNPRQFHFIKTQSTAAFAANAILRRNIYIRTKYEFTVGWRYTQCEPMDLVTLTDTRLGFSKIPVRITEIEQAENGELKIVAEEFPWGTATPTLYPKQSPTSFNPQADADPGLVNTPVLYEPTARATQYGGYEMWLGVSGQTPANWGGCEVWVSADGTNYKQIGTIFGGARMGVLTATLANTADPDTVDTCAVDLTQSAGTLSSGSASDADNFRTLCLVDTELISYQTATLTATYKYNLTTRLRRGVFGSTVASHASGAKFMRIDDGVFKYSYDPQWIGQTVHFKFLSFNKMQLKKQTLANATDYTYTISGVRGSIDQLTGSYTGTLDTIADGTTYGKTVNTYLSLNRPVVNFADTFHSNKNLANIADDATSGRFAKRVHRVAAGNASSAWYKLGTWVFTADGTGHSIHIEMVNGNGYNSNNNQQTLTDIVVRASNGAAAPNISGCTWIAQGNSNGVLAVKVVASGGSTSAANGSWEIWAQIGAFGDYSLHVDLDPSDTWTNAGTSGSDPGVASSTVVVGTGQTLLDTNSNIQSGVGITGKSLTVGTVHDRVNNALTASYNLASGSKIGGDSGMGVSGNVISSSDVYAQSAGTTKFRINNTSGRQWSIASV